jgi:hypothetical protein
MLYNLSTHMNLKEA